MTIETRFSAEVSSVQEVFLTWQTYDEANQNKKSIGQNLPGVMATAFRCKADAVVNSNSLRLSCKVPLDVADGTYYLTSISIQTGDYEKTYSWHDEPFFVQVRIQGGEAVPDPQITSVELQ